MIPPHEVYMQRALDLARQAEALGEVPVGAIIVLNDTIIGAAYNTPISSNDPCAHAEINALRQAANHIGNYRLLDTILYVTLEPCAMCAAAMVHARIKHLVYACDDSKTGAVKTQLQLLQQPMMNHRVTWESGILATEAAAMLKNFFKVRRKK